MALHTWPLPKIPGLYQSFRDIKDKYPIGTDLELIDDVRFIKSIEKKPDRRLCVNTDIARAMMNKGRDVANKRPWMVLDKEALTFDAYCRITLFGNAGEINCMIRKLKIVYYLVDETIQVFEPEQPNSGISQGCFIKRQKMPLPGCDPETGPYYKLTDLVVGEKVIFYGKELMIIGADNYTRDFMNKMGVNLMDNQPVPEDPYYAFRKRTEMDITFKEKTNFLRSRIPNDLDHLALKFRGYWDNRYDVEGDLHFYQVLYYLEDDTMELVEEIPDERDTHGTIRKLIVKRQKLPRNGPWSVPPSYYNKQEILKVISKSPTQFYYKMDTRLLRDDDDWYYTYKDLYIGAILNVYNRSIILVKCDEFTKNYYKIVFGIEKMEPIEAPKTLREIEEDKLNEKREEIIIQNQDEVARIRLVEHGGGSGMVFGFIVQMITDDPINKQRKFMLKYYLDDTEFAVYEYTETNSGISGGMFRSKRGFDKHQKGEDLFVFHQLKAGFNVVIDEFKFIITDVDDRSIKFMIKNSEEFAHSNLETCKNKAREMINGRFKNLDEFRTECFQDRDLVEREEFRNVMSFDEKLDPHVGVVLAYVYKRPDPFEPFSDHELRSVVQDSLKKGQFLNFEGLKYGFKIREVFTGQNNVHIGHKESMNIMKSNRVPLSSDIIDILINKFSNPENGSVNYEDLIEFMDYSKDPVDSPNGLARELLFAKPKKVLIKINEFVDALRPEASPR